MIDPERVDLDPLRRSIAELAEFFAQQERYRRDGNDLFRRAFRSASIQGFEVCYELAISTVRRYLKTEEPLADRIQLAGLKDTMRHAARVGLVDDPEIWFQFRDQRNQTAHTYAEGAADAVLAILPRFIEEASRLVRRMQELLDAS